MSIDRKDILIHGGIGMAVGVAAVFISGWLLLANGMFWLGREAWQRHQKGQSLRLLVTEPQVLLEWLVPIFASLLIITAYHAA